MSPDRLPVGGAVILPVPCRATSRAAIHSLLDDHDWLDIMPEPTTPLSALGSALTQNFPAPKGTRHTCFPYENSSKGKKIGRHDPKEHLSVDDRFCGAAAIATLSMRQPEPEPGGKKPKPEWTGRINLEPYDPDKERAILGYMRHCMDYIPSGKLLKLVLDIVEKLGGRRLIEGQSAFWITADAIPLFKTVAAQIEAASAKTDHDGNEVPPTTIAVLSVLADEAMARTVIAMLMNVVDGEAARVNRRLEESASSFEQANNDIAKAKEVHQELERYEKLLQQPLTALKERTAKLRVRIAEKGLERAAMGL